MWNGLRKLGHLRGRRPDPIVRRKVREAYSALAPIWCSRDNKAKSRVPRFHIAVQTRPQRNLRDETNWALPAALRLRRKAGSLKSPAALSQSTASAQPVLAATPLAPRFFRRELNTNHPSNDSVVPTNTACVSLVLADNTHVSQVIGNMFQSTIIDSQHATDAQRARPYGNMPRGWQ